ncbi:hypothetical protein DPMN_132719 [Dreissena polymorpha]|uniref:Uncharacterized protein n=1 Tax=Dreissena polymorpha TaxID=45954 RepID=A0A9D4FVM6_DREPO|nr:hypothetical protein DPMN_132719 [Dreissena polymorpha]
MVQVKNLEHPVGILKKKIPAVRGVEDLLSSMSMLKRVKTSDLLAQAKGKAKERREVEKKRWNRWNEKTCWVPGCMEVAKYLKAHAFFTHVLTTLYTVQFVEILVRALENITVRVKQNQCV